MVILINQVYAQVSSVPFIPLPPRGELISSLILLIMAVSIGLGIIGSIFGLSSIKKVGSN
jgi:cell division transport system permease protein